MAVVLEKEASDKPASWPREVAAHVSYLQTGIVNVCFVRSHALGNSHRWCLIDAGMPLYTDAILESAAHLFGAGSRPEAIVLTHGHFDHVGCLYELATHWDVPVYAHRLEMPYLTGRSSYLPPDSTVGGGMMASLSWLCPREPLDLRGQVKELPADGSIPGLPEWTWIHTPGHTPGHVSLFRDADRALIAGDAFVNVKQESLLAVLLQHPQVHAPPAYFTPDWFAAQRSVELLASLDPRFAITGHGLPLKGDELRSGLRTLASKFATRSVPKYGRYVETPATADLSGVTFVPPDVPHPARMFAYGTAVGLLLTISTNWLRRRA